MMVFGSGQPAWAMESGPAGDMVEETANSFPPTSASYEDSHLELVDRLANRIEQDPFNLVALMIFLCAILHTFSAGMITEWSHRIEHRYQEAKRAAGRGDDDSVSFLGKLLHFLGEIEAIFGIWVLVLMGAITYYHDWHEAIHYVNGSVNYTEPLFVVVIMAISATRPILNFAENVLRYGARFGGGGIAAWWLTILILAPILGSFITEPAAMTIAAMLLSKQFFRLQPSAKFKYATIGLLFVNISVGGTLTNFAAPPVLMVAEPWDWSTLFMLTNFGWKAVVGIVVASLVYFVIFRGEFQNLERYKREHRQSRVEMAEDDSYPVPAWVILVHVGFLIWTVFNAHYPALFIGGFLFFIGFMQMTPQHQNRLELRSPILVGFFLAGLVNHGGVQGWWISPVLSSLTEVPLMVIATGLTAFNDNAAITYLSTLVEGLSGDLKYAVVAGAVTGGGLTVIANAPNPAGQAILSRFFSNRSVSPLYLALAALFPTIVLGLVFMLIG
jgi:hypothetical protein